MICLNRAIKACDIVVGTFKMSPIPQLVDQLHFIIPFPYTSETTSLRTNKSANMISKILPTIKKEIKEILDQEALPSERVMSRIYAMLEI